MNNKPPSDNIPSELASTNSNNSSSTLSSLQESGPFRSAPAASSSSAHIDNEDEKLAIPPAFRQFLSFSQPAVLEEEVVYRSLMPQIADGPTGLYNPPSKGELDLQPPTLMAFKSAPMVNNPWQVNGAGKSGAALQGGVKARSDVAEQLSQVSSAPVPELPTYFEKYTSFHSLCFPQKIFEQLVEALKTLSVDFELLGARQQIQGCFYEEHNSAKFQINLFKTGKKYLVEVQRRSGDSMAFNALYQRLKKELSASAQSIIEQSPAQQQAPPAAPARPPAYDVVLDQASLQPLKTMAESQYVDVAREGMKMLARCSTSVDNHLLLSSQCLDLFRSRLSSPDEELARYAAFILANLSKTSAVSEHLSSTAQILEALFLVLQRTDSKEIRRQLAQSVHNVSLSRPNCFSKDQLEILRPLRASPDTRLSQLIDNTLARFQVGQV